MNETILINHDNIKIDGTFEEWVRSIAAEIKRLLAVKSEEPEVHQPEYSVEVEPTDWSSEQDGSMPAFMILIYMNTSGLKTHFSFAKSEWDRNCKNPGSLQAIFQCRFIDCIWSLHYLVRPQVILLKRLGVDCNKSYY